MLFENNVEDEEVFFGFALSDEEVSRWLRSFETDVLLILFILVVAALDDDLKWVEENDDAGDGL